MQSDIGVMLDELKIVLPGLSDKQYGRFAVYYERLIDYNMRINLTAITDPVDVARKHFADSAAAISLIPQGASCIDVGTGAGFPGLPLLILRPDIKLTLLDSLNKRIAFLQAVVDQIGLAAKFIHARAEDAGHENSFRERFDIALSRAVAPANVLLELTLPFVNVGGASLMYKGPQAQEEMQCSQVAAKKLCSAISLVECPSEWGERNCIVATKLRKLPPSYPRKPSAIKKKPL